MQQFGFAYPVVLVRRDGNTLVRFPDLPEALTEGADEKDALHQAADCLEEAIAGRIRRGDAIPRPSRPRKGQHVVPVPAQTAGKAALYLALGSAGLSASALARRLGCRTKDIRQLLDPKRPAELRHLQRALEALGQHLVMEMRAA